VKLHPLELGDADEAQGGDETVAIGNPFGLERTLTTGVVSALQRRITAPSGFAIEDVIQTDAALNPATPAAADRRGGRVIGVNSQIATGSVDERRTPDRLRGADQHRQGGDPAAGEGRRVRRAYLGIKGRTVDAALRALGVPADAGVMVENVVPAAPPRDRCARTTAATSPTATSCRRSPASVRSDEDLLHALHGAQPGEAREVSARAFCSARGAAGDVMWMTVLSAPHGGRLPPLTSRFGRALRRAVQIPSTPWSTPRSAASPASRTPSWRPSSAPGRSGSSSGAVAARRRPGRRGGHRAALRRRVELGRRVRQPPLDEIAHARTRSAHARPAARRRGPGVLRAVAQRTGAKVIKAVRVASARRPAGLERFHTDFHLLDTRRGHARRHRATWDWALAAAAARRPADPLGRADAGNVAAGSPPCTRAASTSPPASRPRPASRTRAS
jgi:hypothetical protein